MSRELERLLDSDEVAELLGVPKRSLDQWAYLHTGPPFLRIGRHRRYRPSDLNKWLEAQAVATERVAQ